MAASVRLVRLALALAVLSAASSADARLLTPAGAGPLPGIGHAARLALDAGELARLRGRQDDLVRDFPLGHARTADLALERFDPFAPGARVEVMEAGGPRPLPLPDQAYFRGTVV